MEVDEKEYSDMLKRVFTPALLSLGFFGNIVSIIIFTRPTMNKQTTFRFLTYLSILDLCSLFTGYGHIMLIVYFDFDFRLVNEFSCKLHSFLVYFFTQSSSMILIFMSVDRAIKVTTKHGSKLSSPTIANKIFLIIILTISLVNSHFLIFVRLISFSHTTMDNETDIKIVQACYGDPSSAYYDYLVHFFPWVDLFIYAIFPTIVMLGCTVIIGIKIFNVNKKLTNHVRVDKFSKKRTSKNRQITYLLIITNLTFFCLVTPLVFLNAFKSIDENSIKTTIFYFLSYSNHGVNFIFYGISCENYRLEFLKLIGCTNKKGDKSANLIKNKNYNLVRFNVLQQEQTVNEKMKKHFSVEISLNLLEPIISRSIYNTIESYENGGAQPNSKNNY